MTELINLYPSIKPYDTGFMAAGEHEIYYEQCGNPNGKPAVFLHGGPGGGGSEAVRRFFNPEAQLKSTTFSSLFIIPFSKAI